MVTNSYYESAHGHSMALAIENFIEKNSIKKENVAVTPLNENDSVIIRIYGNDWNVIKSREAETLTYPGDSDDMFVWKCITRSSGTLSLRK